jgi:hypothetical protein
MTINGGRSEILTVNELDNVGKGTEGEESNTNGLRDLQEFTAVGCMRCVSFAVHLSVSVQGEGELHTLCAFGNELGALLEEILRDGGELLELVGHDCGFGGGG